MIIGRGTRGRPLVTTTSSDAPWAAPGPGAIIDGMRYRRAVEKLRVLGEACTSSTRLPLDEPFLREAYVFGEVLSGADPSSA